MLTEHIQKVSSVASLRKTDLNPFPVTLLALDPYLIGWYRGAYSYAEKQVLYHGKPFTIAVGSEQLADSLSILSGDDTNISVDTKGLHLGDGRAELRLTSQDPEDRRSPSASKVVAELVVDGPTLLREIEVSKNFVSTSMVNPLYTGVRLRAKGTTAVIIAFDGIGSLLISTIPVKCEGEFDITITAYDFGEILRIAGDGALTLRQTDAPLGIALVNESSYCYCTALTGTWPELGRITKHTEGTEIAFSKNDLNTLAGAVRVLKAHSNVILHGDGETITAEVADTEVGDFKLAIGSFAEKRDITLDIGHLSMAAQLGEDISLVVPAEPTLPLHAYSKTRKFWFLPRFGR